MAGRSPDDEVVHLVQQGLNHCDLAGHLAATNNGSKGPLGVGDGTIKVVQLLPTGVVSKQNESSMSSG